MPASSTRFHAVLWAILAVLLAAVLTGFYLTSQRSSDQTAVAQTPSVPTNLVDGSLIQTAHQLSMTATTADEQNFARQALALSDLNWIRRFSLPFAMRWLKLRR
ncbi:MAG: hypothetical protein WA324_11755 [Bryobacteraceae bacterium]